MAYNEYLADRIRNILSEKKIGYKEMKMMGGLCFMVNDKMCIGIIKDEFMARIDPGLYNNALSKTGCKEMNFTGRPMKGFVFIEPVGTDTETDLNYWVQLCLDYNPKAVSSKKKN